MILLTVCYYNYAQLCYYQHIYYPEMMTHLNVSRMIIKIKQHNNFLHKNIYNRYPVIIHYIRHLQIIGAV